MAGLQIVKLYLVSVTLFDCGRVIAAVMINSGKLSNQNTNYTTIHRQIRIIVLRNTVDEYLDRYIFSLPP